MPDHSALRGQTVLVTGGHGFIGRHVVIALAEAGAKPIAISQGPASSVSSLPGESVTLDLEDRRQVVEAVRGVDRVVHLAARAGGIQFQQEIGEDVFASNRRMTDNVLTACSTAGVERVFLASSLVTYREATEPLTETHTQLGPSDRPDPYAWSKITDEVAAGWVKGLNTVVGRFGNVYGPGASFEPERSTVIHALIDRAARCGDGNDLVVWGDNTAIRSFVFVEDAATGVLCALAEGEPGAAYNIDSGVDVSITQLATKVRDLIDPSLNLTFDPSKPTGTAYRVASIAKLTALGYRPRFDLDEGLRRTVDWYREHVLSP